jgi:ATP-dependent Clp protease ATP-binding subunit ClpB
LDYAADLGMAEKLRDYRKRYDSSETERAQRRAEDARRRRQLFPLEERLHQHIVGQDGPIMAVSAAVRRKENGWHDEDHPLVFLFLGSSGVGKVGAHVWHRMSTFSLGCVGDGRGFCCC